jgi:hypothetical protein
MSPIPEDIGGSTIPEFIILLNICATLQSLPSSLCPGFSVLQQGELTAIIYSPHVHVVVGTSSRQANTDRRKYELARQLPSAMEKGKGIY